jgi:hypothetical protein
VFLILASATPPRKKYKPKVTPKIAVDRIMDESRTLFRTLKRLTGAQDKGERIIK